MAVDYVLKFPCEVRKQVANDKLVTLVGYMGLAEFAVAEVRKTNPNLPMADILKNVQVKVDQRRPDGVVRQIPMSVGDLVELAQSIGHLRGHCGPCRANIADRPFGCIAKINYPITKEAEEWLVSRLPDDVANPGLSTLFRFLSDLEITGAPIDTLRPNLCELQAPVVRAWDGPQGQAQVSSSQILHMLIFGGDIGAQQAALFTQLLGLESVLSDPHPPSSSIEQFKTLACAIVMAGRLNAEIELQA